MKLNQVAKQTIDRNQKKKSYRMEIKRVVRSLNDSAGNKTSALAGVFSGFYKEEGAIHDIMIVFGEDGEYFNKIGLDTYHSKFSLFVDYFNLVCPKIELDLTQSKDSASFRRKVFRILLKTLKDKVIPCCHNSNVHPRFSAESLASCYSKLEAHDDPT